MFLQWIHIQNFTTPKQAIIYEISFCIMLSCLVLVWWPLLNRLHMLMNPNTILVLIFTEQSFRQITTWQRVEQCVKSAMGWFSDTFDRLVDHFRIVCKRWWIPTQFLIVSFMEQIFSHSHHDNVQSTHSGEIIKFGNLESFRYINYALTLSCYVTHTAKQLQRVKQG